MRSLACLSLAIVALLAGCQSGPGYDYTEYLEHPPRSILVLPPLDTTVETEACYGCLSTVTRPIAERGFYVFPVAVVDAFMRQNGLPTAYEMHEVPLAKLREVFAPDAVLYLTVSDWGTSYQLVDSVTTVTLQARLVDAETGDLLWAGERSLSQGSGGGGGGLAGMLASALVNQVATSIADPSREVSRAAAVQLFEGGLLPGPYHPDHEVGLQKVRADLAARKQGE